MVEGKLEQKENKPGDWVMIYVIITALGLTVLGLVMLFQCWSCTRCTGTLNQASDLAYSITRDGCLCYLYQS